jgi:hypothetical protein
VQDVELGVRVRIRDHQTSDDVGVATMPGPVQFGDLVALDHGEPLIVTHVLEPLPGAIATPVLARPFRLPAPAR